MPEPSTPRRSTGRTHPPRRRYNNNNNNNGDPSPMTMQNYTNLLNSTRRAQMGIAGAAPPVKKVPGAPKKKPSKYGHAVELNNLGFPGREANTTNVSTTAGPLGELPPGVVTQPNFSRKVNGGAYTRRRKHTTRRRKQSIRHRRH
jgi:hypothetical protein